MVLVYIFDLFKDNLFIFFRGYIIVRNYFLNYELFIIYEKNFYLRRFFFILYVLVRVNFFLINNKMFYGNFFLIVG